VIRYFELALTPGQRFVTSARVEQEGEFRASEAGSWSPFTATPHYQIDPPGPGSRLDPVDASVAMATLVDGPNRVALEFRFGLHGEIVQAYTPARYRALDGTYVPTPWTCSYDRYVQVGDMRVPLAAELARGGRKAHSPISEGSGRNSPPVLTRRR
jgi:hypothetical protein